MSKYIIETGVCPNNSCRGVVLKDVTPFVTYSCCMDCGQLLVYKDKEDGRQYHPENIHTYKVDFLWEFSGCARLAEALEARYFREYENIHFDPRQLRASLKEVMGSKGDGLYLFLEAARGHVRRMTRIIAPEGDCRLNLPSLDIDQPEPFAFSTAPVYDLPRVVVTDSILKALLLNYSWYTLESYRLPVVVSSNKLPLWGSVDAGGVVVFCSPASEAVMEAWLLESGVSNCIFNTGDVFGMANEFTLTKAIRSSLHLLEERRDATGSHLSARQRMCEHGKERVVRFNSGAVAPS